MVIHEHEVSVDTYRTGGGGVNTNPAAVQVRHLRTGVYVTCSTTRSRRKNTAIALQLLEEKMQRTGIK